MTIGYINTILQRDLNKLQQEISNYRDEENIWRIDKAIANSAGNLSLHLAGNLRHYVGFRLGGIDYARQRDREFSEKGVPREELLALLETTKAAVNDTLKDMTDDIMQMEYPENVFGGKMTTGYFLIHLSAHLGYHLGQVNYHRRLLDA